MQITNCSDNFGPKSAHFGPNQPHFQPGPEIHDNQSDRRPAGGGLCCRAHTNESIGRPKNLPRGVWGRWGRCPKTSSFFSPENHLSTPQIPLKYAPPHPKYTPLPHKWPEGRGTKILGFSGSHRAPTTRVCARNDPRRLWAILKFFVIFALWAHSTTQDHHPEWAPRRKIRKSRNPPRVVRGPLPQ